MTSSTLTQPKRRTFSGPDVKRLYGTDSVTMEQVFNADVQVPESSTGVDTGFDVQPLDRMVFRASGEIWAGVWLTGENTPRGWNNTDNDPKFPLPGGHPYSLLGRLGGLYFEIGDGLERVWNGPGAERLFLRTNDDTPGNGSGAFTCNVQVFRRV
jgi:hypothetical protein